MIHDLTHFICVFVGSYIVKVFKTSKQQHCHFPRAVCLVFRIEIGPFHLVGGYKASAVSVLGGKSAVYSQGTWTMRPQ